MIPITEVAEKAGIDEKHLELYGKYMAKVNLNIREELPERKGKLILVTATNPTPAGEGKTTNYEYTLNDEFIDNQVWVLFLVLKVVPQEVESQD